MTLKAAKQELKYFCDLVKREKENYKTLQSVFLEMYSPHGGDALRHQDKVVGEAVDSRDKAAMNLLAIERIARFEEEEG